MRSSASTITESLKRKQNRLHNNDRRRKREGKLDSPKPGKRHPTPSSPSSSPESDDHRSKATKKRRITSEIRPVACFVEPSLSLRAVQRYVITFSLTYDLIFIVAIVMRAIFSKSNHNNNNSSIITSAYGIAIFALNCVNKLAIALCLCGLRRMSTPDESFTRSSESKGRVEDEQFREQKRRRFRRVNGNNLRSRGFRIVTIRIYQAVNGAVVMLVCALLLLSCAFVFEDSLEWSDSLPIGQVLLFVYEVTFIAINGFVLSLVTHTINRLKVECDNCGDDEDAEQQKYHRRQKLIRSLRFYDEGDKRSRLRQLSPTPSDNSSNASEFDLTAIIKDSFLLIAKQMEQEVVRLMAMATITSDK